MKDIRHHLHHIEGETADTIIKDHGIDKENVSAVYQAQNDHVIIDEDEKNVQTIFFLNDHSVATSDEAWLGEDLTTYPTMELFINTVTIEKTVQVW